MSKHLTFSNGIIEVSEFSPEAIRKYESVFAQGNGYLNIRCSPEETYTEQSRGAFIAGLFNRAMKDEVTELANLPDVAFLDIRINGEIFSLERGNFSDYSFALNLNTGEVMRRVIWTSPADDLILFEFSRFVSLSIKHLAAFNLKITPLNCNAEISIDSGINSRITCTGSQHFNEGEKRLLSGHILRLCTRTSDSDIPVVIHCTHRFSAKASQIVPVMERRRFMMRYVFQLSKKQTFSMEKFACYHTGRDQEFTTLKNPEGLHDFSLICSAGIQCINNVLSSNYKLLLEESSQAWKSFYDSCAVQINSRNPIEQTGMQFALYHLNLMICRGDYRMGIGAKGLTGEGYKGHSFWDTEMYLLPFYLLTDPKSARALLEYRYACLPTAVEKAAANQYGGAMFPWESAWITDGDATPLYGPADILTGQRMEILTGKLEHHITADIAWGVWQYYSTTNDDEFMDLYGCELLIETARFWCTRMEWKNEVKRYEICDLIGPDEYKEHIDNNAYTNYLVAFNLNRAASVIKKIHCWPKADALLCAKYDLRSLRNEFTEKEKLLYLPKANTNGIIPQNDQFLNLEEIDLTEYRKQSGISSIYSDYSPSQINKLMLSKQADLVMLLRLMPSLFEREVQRKNYIFYESHTVHDSSLSCGQHCILASQLGLQQEALDFFHQALTVDLGETLHSSDDGIHAAAMGNIWQCAVYGFAGFSVNSKGISLSPQIPDIWESLSFKITLRGTLLFIKITHNEIVCTNLKGPSLLLFLKDAEYKLISGQELHISLNTEV